jgi:hypothetical protein
MNKTKITVWLEKGKPTKVVTNESQEVFIDDLSGMYEKWLKEKVKKDARKSANKG